MHSSVLYKCGYQCFHYKPIFDQLCWQDMPPDTDCMITNSLDLNLLRIPILPYLVSDTSFRLFLYQNMIWWTLTWRAWSLGSFTSTSHVTDMPGSVKHLKSETSVQRTDLFDQRWMCKLWSKLLQLASLQYTGCAQRQAPGKDNTHHY